MRILVVENDPLVARTLALVFRSSGFDTTTVADAESALSSIRLCPPDLLLCDIDLPGRDGVELMTDLGAENPKLPILVLTGFYGSLARVRACARKLPQAVDIYTKPCPPQDLLKAAGSMLFGTA